MNLKCFPVDISRWKDFKELFGEKGACGGCWCMAWRLQAKEFEKRKGAINKRSMKEIIDNKELPGILGYINNKPVGWCSVAPRDKFIRLKNSRVLAKIDDKPVWSITCFFITKSYRKQGLSSQLLKGVIEFSRDKNVKILEAYPTEPYSDNIPAAFVWTGIPSSFKKVGFKVVARRSPKRPIMRYYL